MNSTKTMARTAGVLYLIIAIGAGFSYGYIQSTVYEAGNAPATAGNITATPGMFRLCIAAGLVAFLCDIGVAAIFYTLLKPVSKTLSFTATLLRLAQTAILGINVLNLLAALTVVSNADYSGSFTTAQLQSMGLLFLNMYQYGFDIAMVFFGVHCLLLGYLLFQSAYFPKVLGILLALAGMSYLADSFTKFLLPQYGAATAVIVAVTAIIAELALTFRLIVKGISVNNE
jgi:hypothetical protein